MELLRKIFKDEEKVVGLCAFKKDEKKEPVCEFIHNWQNPAFYTDTKNNIFML